MKFDECDINKVTPMMRQYMEIKKENKDIILFYRLGDFYEMFFEDAVTSSRELELTLTGKNAGLDERIPMCGVPHHSASIYIDKLVEKGYKVGICEQLEDPKNAKGIVKRDIIQIVSKGTLINNESLIEYENNYIGSVLEFKDTFIISYADISTGEMYSSFVEKNISKLVSEIVSIGIKEVILENKIDKTVVNLLKNQFQITVSITDEIIEDTNYNYIYIDVSDIRIIQSIKYLLTYITKTQKRNLSHLQKVVLKENKEYLKMDIHTKRNLELTEILRLKQRNYSLIWLLDKTKTAMGSRRLKRLIEYPLVDINKINKRYDMVETLLKEFILKSDLTLLLDSVYDLERLSGRIGI